MGCAESSSEKEMSETDLRQWMKTERRAADRQRRSGASPSNATPEELSRTQIPVGEPPDSSSDSSGPRQRKFSGGAQGNRTGAENWQRQPANEQAQLSKPSANDGGRRDASDKWNPLAPEARQPSIIAVEPRAWSLSPAATQSPQAHFESSRKKSATDEAATTSSDNAGSQLLPSVPDSVESHSTDNTGEERSSSVVDSVSCMPPEESPRRHGGYFE